MKYRDSRLFVLYVSCGTYEQQTNISHGVRQGVLLPTCTFQCIYSDRSGRDEGKTGVERSVKDNIALLSEIGVDGSFRGNWRHLRIQIQRKTKHGLDKDSCGKQAWYSDWGDIVGKAFRECWPT